MFYDSGSNSNSREAWKYPYTGTELLAPATTQMRAFRQREMAAREELSKLLNDPGVSQQDSRISELRSAIERNGRQYEACTVFVTAFTREPERTFLLAISDIVYFDLQIKPA